MRRRVEAHTIAAAAIKAFRKSGAVLTENQFIDRMLPLVAARDAAQFTADDLPAWNEAVAAWRDARMEPMLGIATDEAA